MNELRRCRLIPILALALLLLGGGLAFAGEADLAIPDLHEGHFTIAGQEISAWNLLFYGALVITGTLGISLYLRHQIKNPAGARIDARHLRDHLSDLQDLPHSAGQVPADAVRDHRRGHDVLLHGLARTSLLTTALLVLLFSVVGMGGSYGWPGTASASTPTPTRRTAFASLARRAVGRGQHSAARRHVGRLVPDFARTGDDGHHPAVRAARDRRHTASSASPSANRWAPRPCASRAASSPRSPTSAPT